MDNFLEQLQDSLGIDKAKQDVPPCPTPVYAITLHMALPLVVDWVVPSGKDDQDFDWESKQNIGLDILKQMYPEGVHVDVAVLSDVGEENITNSKDIEEWHLKYGHSHKKDGTPKSAAEKLVHEDEPVQKIHKTPVVLFNHPNNAGLKATALKVLQAYLYPPDETTIDYVNVDSNGKLVEVILNSGTTLYAKIIEKNAWEQNNPSPIEKLLAYHGYTPSAKEQVKHVQYDDKGKLVDITLLDGTVLLNEEDDDKPNIGFKAYDNPEVLKELLSPKALKNTALDFEAFSGGATGSDEYLEAAPDELPWPPLSDKF